MHTDALEFPNLNSFALECIFLLCLLASKIFDVGINQDLTMNDTKRLKQRSEEIRGAAQKF